MDRSYVDGWRGRIGLITPAPGSSTEYEFNTYKPEGVAVLTTRVPLFGISYEGIKEMSGYVDAAAAMLARSAIVDLVIFSCTAGSFLEGKGYDMELTQHLEELTGVRSTTTSTCILEAIETLGIKSMNIVTPYSAEVNELEKRFFESCGIRVTGITGALLDMSQNTPKIPSRDMYRFAVTTDVPDADATFISCTGLHVLDIIEKLETDLGKPCLTINQCGLWGCLRKIGVKERLPGLGRLFSY
jgi:maleate cis-trans isomerase